MGSDGQPQPTTSDQQLAAEVAALRVRVESLEQQLSHLHPAAPATIHMAVPKASANASPLPPPPPRTSARAEVFTPLPSQASLEDRLGSQIFSRVGIVALLIGATWFLKLAIDNQWIGPVGRVLAGLLAGAGLILWSERFRRTGFAAFSYSLKAIGTGVLYLTLWAAFQLYHLLPANAALAVMVLVTAWNAYMAWVQDAEVLAAYALIGGLATPLLLSTGGNHETFLFTYLLAIVAATVVLVRLKPWPRLLLAVFPATVAYFIGWYWQFFAAPMFGVTSLFIAAFYVAYATVPLGYLRTAGSSTALCRPQAALITEIFLPLANAAFGALAFYSVLQDSSRHADLPWLMVLFAAFYLGWMRLPQARVAAAVHLSLAIVFLTIAIPLKASGHWITISWLVEGTVLLWLAARLPAASSPEEHSPAEAHRVLRWLALSSLGLGLIGLLLHPLLFGDSYAVAFFNSRFATALVGIAAFSAAVWVALRASRDDASEPWLAIAGAAIIAINVVAVQACVSEIETYWNRSSANHEVELQRALAISAFLMLYGAFLLAVGFWKRTAFVRWQALLLLVVTIAKTFLYDMRSLSQGYRVVSFLGLGALLMAISFAYQGDWLGLRDTHAAAPPEQEAQ